MARNDRERYTEEINQLFDRLRPGFMEDHPPVESLQRGIQPAGWIKIEDAESQEIAAVGRQVDKFSGQSIPASTWTKVTGYSTTPIVGVGTTWTPYGGHEIRVDVPGVYLIQMTAQLTGSSLGSRFIIAPSFATASTPTGSPVQPHWAQSNPNAVLNALRGSWIVYLNATQTVAMFVWQDAGALTLSYADMGIFRMGV